MPAAAILKVLVVDDQNSVRQMTRITLEQIGIRQIHEAENGKQAMDTAALQPLDLIISDFNMPEMDGLALLRAVRGHPAARKVPFILLTGRGDRELVVKAAQAGANNYLIKPFTADILRQKIEQVMGRLSRRNNRRAEVLLRQVLPPQVLQRPGSTMSENFSASWRRSCMRRS